MIKKLIRLTIAVLILFSIASLTACNGDLVQYKTDAKAELDICVATKDEADYSGDNWTKVLGFAAAGKTAIDDAADKAGVDSAVTTAKIEINEVKKKEAGMSIPFDEGVFEGHFVGLNGDEIFSAVVRNKQELIAFFDGRSVTWSSDSPIWDNYGETYFNGDALVLYFFWASSTDFSFSVSDVKIYNDILRLDIMGGYYGSAVNDAMQFVPIIVEVAKSDIDSTSTVSVNIQYKDLQNN